MILFKQAISIQTHIKQIKKEGKTIGFVPTMGALHEGHLSLLNNCRKNADVTVSSIFVNPTQFNDKKDFDKYPVTIAEDILQLEKNNCDILFLPSVNEMYPNGTALKKQYDLGSLEKVFEGSFRPGHFQGVSQVVERLLKIVEPDKMFLGQKDFQQCKVIERLIELLELPVELVIGETQREPSGLAMSSRNMRLNDQQKQEALAIYDALIDINQHYKRESFQKLEDKQTKYLLNNGFTKVDYIKIADAQTLQATEIYNAKKKYVALVAAFIGDVRLIDNMLLH